MICLNGETLKPVGLFPEGIMQNNPMRQSLSAIALGIVVFSATVSTAANASAKPTLPVVPAMEVASMPVNFEKSYVGRITPVDHVRIVTKVPGEVKTVNFKEGSFVEAGDVLFTLDAEPYEVALEAAKAALQGAIAQHENAVLTLNRSEELIKRKAVSEQQVLDHRAAARIAAANVAKARAAGKAAALELRYTKIIAPVSGRVGSRNVSVGDLVGNEPPVTVLTEMMVMDPVNVVMSVSEKDLLNATIEHTELELKLANGDVYPKVAKVDFVDNSVSINSGTIKVRASFPNPEGKLVPGLFTTVKATDIRARNLISIPQRVVMENQSGRYVYVADADNKVAIRPVTTGPRIGVQWVINEGLEQGDVVLTSNLQLLRPGQEVTLKMAGDA
ncbi:hypothetical protein ACH42_02560 [Endozoicomonas sp. (ex Bugula neritina AB1)]|nr:hypothetical protein ACH42_02560 [Endozoicomonas sp. (ex Bugula neritina AB1)]